MRDWFVDCIRHAIDALQTYNGAVTAFATAGIAVFTIVLACVSRRQAKLTRDAIRIANKEFISTHRPRIIVREVLFPVLLPTEGTPFAIVYTVANVGETQGRIVESVIGGEFIDQPRILEIQDPRGRNEIGNIALEAGASIRLSFLFHGIAWGNDRLTVFGDGIGLFFVARIIYADDLGVRRNTVFRRQYYPQRRRFYPVNDSELEYAD